MKVMLTGASGFIGSHILSQLTKILGKESVVALTSIQIPNINCIIYNTIQNFGLHSDQFDDITHIIHAGAFIPKDRQKSDDMKKCYENLEFTQELLSFDYKKLKRIINLSTIDVYKATSEILSEDSLIEPVSLYGLSKLYNLMIKDTYHSDSQRLAWATQSHETHKSKEYREKMVEEVEAKAAKVAQQLQA